MPFVLGQQRVYKFIVQPPVGITLSLREFTADERNEFEKEFRIVSNMPGGQKHDDAYDAVLEKTARLLLVDWEGVQGADGKPLELNPETKADFFEDRETAKFWRLAVRGYLFPVVTAG